MGDTKLLIVPEEIKSLFRKNSIRKNIRIHFPNGEREDITNSNLLSESFSFTESISSGNDIKFGLCEASKIEFECFDIEYIKGMEIFAYCEIDISSLSEEFIAEYGQYSEDVAFPFYRIPYGKFTIDSCKRQSNMRRRKVIAYSWDDVYTSELSNIEKAKRNMIVLNNVPYTADFASFIFSNTKNVFSNDNLFEKETINLETVEQKYLFTIGRNLIGENITLKVTGEIIPIKTTDELATKLIHVDFNKVSNYLQLKNDFVNTLKEYDAIKYSDYFAPYIEILEGGQKDGYYLTNNVTKIPFDTNYLLYPYISGLNLEDYMTVVIPRKILLMRTSNINAHSIIKEWEIAGISTATKCTIAKDVYTKEMSINRSVVPSMYEGIAGYKVLNYSEDNISNIFPSWLELNGMFGKASRNGGIEFFNLKSNRGIYPSETLYPSEELYPSEAGQLLSRYDYQNLYYEEYEVKAIGKVVVDYKNKNGENSIYSCVFDYASPNVYEIKDNYFFKNLQWTEAEIKSILDLYFIPNIRDIAYVPFELDMIGLLYLEAGDYVNILTKDGGINSFILNRSISGIHSMKDFISAKGKELNVDISDKSIVTEGE